MRVLAAPNGKEDGSAMRLEESTVSEVVVRLRRVEGQVRGIIDMIESGRECRDVVRQISAASRALDRAGFKLLASGLRTCLADREAAARAGYSEAELEKLFLQLA